MVHAFGHGKKSCSLALHLDDMDQFLEPGPKALSNLPGGIEFKDVKDVQADRKNATA